MPRYSTSAPDPNPNADPDPDPNPYQVLYLSPHYRHLPASGSSGVAGAAAQGSLYRGGDNMYTELAEQLDALGIQVVSSRRGTSLAEQRARFLLVLCPG